VGAKESAPTSIKQVFGHDSSEEDSPSLSDDSLPSESWSRRSARPVGHTDKGRTVDSPTAEEKDSWVTSASQSKRTDSSSSHWDKRPRGFKELCSHVVAS